MSLNEPKIPASTYRSAWSIQNAKNQGFLLKENIVSMNNSSKFHTNLVYIVIRTKAWITSLFRLIELTNLILAFKTVAICLHMLCNGVQLASLPWMYLLCTAKSVNFLALFMPCSSYTVVVPGPDVVQIWYISNTMMLSSCWTNASP